MDESSTYNTNSWGLPSELGEKYPYLCTKFSFIGLNVLYERGQSISSYAQTLHGFEPIVGSNAKM